MHPDCLAALDDAVTLLTDLGHHVFERDLTELTPRVGSAIGRMYGAAVDWAIRYWVRELGREPGEEELEPLTRLYWERGRSVSGGELLLALTTLQEFSRAVAATTEGPEGFDLWLSPTLAEPPPRLGELAATDNDPTAAEVRSAAFVAFPLVVANITGRPAMNVPLFRNADGLPIGVHLMGPFGGEAMLLRLAAQLEDARPWADVWPPVSCPLPSPPPPHDPGEAMSTATMPHGRGQQPSAPPTRPGRDDALEHEDVPIVTQNGDHRPLSAANSVTVISSR